MKTDITLKLMDIYASCNAFVQNKLSFAGNLRCTVCLVAASVYKGKIAAEIILGSGEAGFLPLWPNLWRNEEVFTFTTMCLMFRQNRGKNFGTQDLRPIKVDTEIAFEAVVYEILF